MSLLVKNDLNISLAIKMLKIIIALYIFLPKMGAYRIHFDKTKYILFFNKRR